LDLFDCAALRIVFFISVVPKTKRDDFFKDRIKES